MGLRPEPLDRGSIMVARGRLGCLLLMLMASRTTATTSAWDCANGLTTAMPIQSLGLGFYALNIETGSYTFLFEIAEEARAYPGGPYPNLLNACGISPIDSRAYCMVQVMPGSGKGLGFGFRV